MTPIMYRVDHERGVVVVWAGGWPPDRTVELDESTLLMLLKAVQR